MNEQLEMFTVTLGLGGLRVVPAVERLVTYVGRRSPDTSIEAAVKARPKSGKQRLQVFEAIKTAGGLTSDELSQRLELPAQSVTARVNSLANDGLIYDSGQRRLTRYNRKAIVWAVSHGV
jgi:transcription initiation factor IIE alpha subunit